MLSATRQNPLRAQAAGFEPFRYRLIACIVSGALASIAGVLLAEQSGFVSPAYQGWRHSGELLAMAILGGVLMGIAARLARGCASGQALTGGGALSLGSWIFMMMFFAGAYLFAPLLKKQWR